ncbi:MAG: DUF4339 domain-containing protein [Tannerella sp.]|nr:DUF4339 domain-containing protein [Tannerella sp.]
MEKEYYYLSGEMKVGPFSLEVLKRAPITPSTLIWDNTFPEWVEARTLPELACLITPPPPPVTPPPPRPAAPQTPNYNTGGRQTYNAGGYNTPHQTVIINPAQSNGIGTAGFVMALIALFLSWIPILGWILWILGLILSFAGLFKNPKGLAIAGFVISLIDLIILLVVVASMAAFLGSAGIF